MVARVSAIRRFGDSRNADVDKSSAESSVGFIDARELAVGTTGEGREGEVTVARDNGRENLSWRRRARRNSEGAQLAPSRDRRSLIMRDLYDRICDGDL